MSWIKILLKISAVLIVLVLIGLGLFYYSAKKSAEVKSNMIEDLAKIPLGSSVDEVMKLALKLGFNIDGKEFAIPSVIEMTNDDLSKSPNGLPEMVTSETNLSKFQNGKLNFGLSLFLFSRKGCEFTFKDGLVKDIRIWWLD